MNAEPEPVPVAFLVCFAVREEAVFCLSCMKAVGGCKVVVTGMGRRNATTRFREALTRFRPGRVLTCGFAGALNPELKVGNLLYDEDFDAGLGKRLLELEAIPAKFYCSTRVAITAAEKADLWRTTGADAVEMESAVIRNLCREEKIPSATLRVISDAANDDLPLDFNALMTSDQRISIPRLMVALVKSPRAIPRLLQLQRNTRLAARRLAVAVDGLVGLPRCRGGR
jgi:nucleoside phosphorylase